MSHPNPPPPPVTYQPFPIPFSTPAIDQQPPINPSMNNLPSTSEFNDPPQAHSYASINYNDEPQLNQATSQRSLGNNNQNNFRQDEQEEELQKISLERNQIDQDEILRMFRQEENRVERSMGRQNQRKKGQVLTGAGNNSKEATGKRASGSHQPHSSKKDQQQPSSKDDPTPTTTRRHQPSQPDEPSLPFITKTTSFKDLKPPQPATLLHSSISTSEPIHMLLLQYKIQYRSSIYDPDWQKERYRLKEQLFEQMCIGVEEMRHKPQIQLSKEEGQVLERVAEIAGSVGTNIPYDFGVFKYCRNLVIELDMQLFIHFHQKSKQPLAKDYKAQYKLLLSNVKDPENYELRRKLLTHQMDAQTIKLATEIEFFTQAKRKEIKSKEQKLLKEFSVDHERSMLKPEFQHEKDEQRITDNISYDVVIEPSRPKTSQAPAESQLQTPLSQQNLPASKDPFQAQHPTSMANYLSYNKYLQESTLSQLEELLSPDQTLRMRNRLEEDLRGECRQRLLGRFDGMVK